MEKRIFKRFLASFLALILVFLCGCFPSAFAAESGGSAMPSDVKAVAIGDALAEMGGLDGGWALTLMSYFSANGISLESYGNDGEDLTRVIMKYYEEYYNEEIASLGGAVLGISDYIANAISGTALGISRIVGAVNGAFNLLIRAPLAAQLQGFLDWWNEKFNPSGSVETTETVEFVKSDSVPFLRCFTEDGKLFDFTTSGGDLFNFSASYDFYTTVSSISLGTPLFSSGSPFSSVVSFPGVSFKKVYYPGSSMYAIDFSLDGGSKWNESGSSVSDDCYLAALYNGVIICYCNSPNDPDYYYFNSLTDSGRLPYSYFYSSVHQFNSSGFSVVTMKQSSDGRLSYGPSGTSAGTIIQSGETISIPVIAPSIEGNAVSFSPFDTVADLVAKALTIVEDSVADAADTVLELPSIVGDLIPDIELFDDLEINWADDTPVTLTPSPSPSPSPVPDLPVTVVPTSFPSPWPVSPDQFAVVTSDGRTALVDITDTIKGWTESLTGIYQSYVDLLGSVFGFLPEEIQVLFKWSMAALIFTGIFKRWWWDHH